MLYPVTIMSNVAVSSTTTYTSTVVDIMAEDNIGIIPIVVSGTPSGTFKVQVSNDGTNFQALTLSAVPTITSGALTNVPVSINQVPFRYIEVTYTNSAGTGNISVTLAAKKISSKG